METLLESFHHTGPIHLYHVKKEEMKCVRLCRKDSERIDYLEIVVYLY